MTRNHTDPRGEKRKKSGTCAGVGEGGRCEKINERNRASAGESDRRLNYHQFPKRMLCVRTNPASRARK